MLLAGQLPGASEPHRQRRAGAMEDRPRRDRGLAATARALPAPARQLPAPLARARRAVPALSPAQPVEVVQAGVVVGEPGQQFTVGTGVVTSRSRMRHPATVPDLDGYPLGRNGGRRLGTPARQAVPNAVYAAVRGTAGPSNQKRRKCSLLAADRNDPPPDGTQRFCALLDFAKCSKTRFQAAFESAQRGERRTRAQRHD